MDTRASTRLLAPTLLTALVAAVIGTGCTVGPTYKRPQLPPVQEFRFQIGPAEANSIADLPWWKLFNDKSLQGLITQAMANNYDLQAAVARIDQARAQVGIARSELFPQVGSRGGAAREKSFVPTEQSGGNITFNTFGVAINSIWELDLWGRIRRSTEAARANLYAQVDVRRGVMLTLASDVAASYFLLIELDRELSIAQESATRYRQTLDLFTARFQLGRDTKLAVLRAKAAYDSANASIARLTRAIGQQENAISTLLGTYPGPIERGTALTQQLLPPGAPGLTTDVLQRRPDIQQMEQVMIGANAEIGVAIANFFPRVGLSALFGTQGPHTDDLFKSHFGIWSIGAVIDAPIYQGGRLRASYNAQKAFWDETVAQYKKTVMSAFSETSDALVAQQTLVNQRAGLQSQVEALSEAVELVLSRYDAGRSNYFEVLDAEQLLYPAEDALAQTQRDQLLAVVDLYKALGGGWNLSEFEWARPPP